MPSTIQVKKNKNLLFQLDKDVFELLFNHTIARRKTKFTTALSSGVVQYDDFMRLTRSSEVPYPLFFLDKATVTKIILNYEKKVYFGTSKTQMSIASRGEVLLADISLILKDITRKQNFIKQYIETDNNLSGQFKKKKQNHKLHAEELRNLLGYDLDKVAGLNKEKTYELLSTGLASQNVFTSLYAHNYTPQTIDKDLHFSGIAINDKKCPFLFIKAGDNDSRIEPWGRRLFTVALLLSCLAWSNCGPLTMNGKSGELSDDKHYIFAEEFLMPEDRMRQEQVSSLLHINAIATKYSVSGSAVVMRLFRLRLIDESTKNEHLQSLIDEWDRITSKKGGGNPLGLEKAINRYNNPAVVRLIIEKHKSKALNSHDAKNLLCYKKGDSFNIEALQSYA